jgi:cytochrome c oxidase assembly protein subunit 20
MIRVYCYGYQHFDPPFADRRHRESLGLTTMAEGSRDPSSSQEPGSHLPASIPNTDPKKPKHDFPQSQVGKLWDAFGNPEEPVNALANATYKPRGKDPKDVSYSDVIGTVSVSEISSFYKKPCARESLLTGIGAGFGIGGVRAVFGGMSIHSDSV